MNPTYNNTAPCTCHQEDPQMTNAAQLLERRATLYYTLGVIFLMILLVAFFIRTVKSSVAAV